MGKISIYAGAHGRFGKSYRLGYHDGSISVYRQFNRDICIDSKVRPAREAKRADN